MTPASPSEDMRLIVRRVRNANDQQRLFDVWCHHAFVTDRTGDPIVLDADHRAHAVQEQVIRELKNGTGLARCPSGQFNATAIVRSAGYSPAPGSYSPPWRTTWPAGPPHSGCAPAR